MAMQTLTTETLVTIYTHGGFIGRTLTGEWWCADHTSTTHRIYQIHHELPIGLVLAGQLCPDQYDPYYGFTRYRLTAPRSLGAWHTTPI